LLLTFFFIILTLSSTFFIVFTKKVAAISADTNSYTQFLLAAVADVDAATAESLFIIIFFLFIFFSI